MYLLHVHVLELVGTISKDICWFTM